MGSPHLLLLVPLLLMQQLRLSLAAVPMMLVSRATTVLPLFSLLFAEAATASPAADAVATFALFDNGSSGDGIDVTMTLEGFEGIVAAAAAAGNNGKDGGTAATPPPPGEAFAVAMSSRIEVSKHGAPRPVVATRAYRGDGELVTEFRQLLPPSEELPDGSERKGRRRRIYLVAEGLEFVWPFVGLGHWQVVSPNVISSPNTTLPDGTVRTEPIVLESLSESPRVFRVHNMASGEEAAAIVATALNKTGEDAMQRSTVGSGTGKNGKDIKRKDYGRTSDNAWDHTSPEARVMISRSFQLTNIAEDEGKRDGLQVVRYTQGQGYNTHPDYFSSYRDGDYSVHPYSGGSNRFATVFMYLNDPEVGGFTVFPRAPAVEEVAMPDEARDMFEPSSWEHKVNRQCYEKLAVAPRMGTAVLFYSITADGRIDPASHHAACPLIRGTKWGANIWIWNKQRHGEIRTGEPRTLRLRNRVPNEWVYVSWEGKPTSKVPPGGSIAMNTFEYHRFRASLGSHEGESIAEFTVQGGPDAQEWEIVRPRRYNDDLHRDRVAGQQRQQQEQQRDGGPPAGARQQRGEGGGGGGTKVLVKVRNRLDSAVRLLWRGEPMFSVEPGTGTTINTFPGHSFSASLADGRVASVYKVEEEAEGGPEEGARYWDIVAPTGEDGDEVGGDGNEEEDDGGHRQRTGDEL